MKRLIWILKCISSVILLFMITQDTFLGRDILWSDLTIAIWIDVLLLICLHPIVKPFSEPKEQHTDIVLYILFYGNTIKGFGYGLSDLTYQLNSLYAIPSSPTSPTIKVKKILISGSTIMWEDVNI